MRCLWLTWIDPFPEHGGQRIYSGRMIEAVAAAGAKVEVLCAANAASHRRDGACEGGVRWSIIGEPPAPAWISVVSSLPNIARRSATRAMQVRLEALLEAREWDCIVFDGLYTGWAVAPILRAIGRARRRPRLVYMSHNHEETTRARLPDGCTGRPIQRAVLRHDARKAARLERRMVAAADLVTAITPEDAELFGRAAPSKPVVVLSPGYHGRRVARRRIDDSVPRRAVIVGSFDWIAKQMNLREFLTVADPLFADGAASLDIVGAGDPRFFDSLRSSLRATRLVGRVDSIDPYLDSSRMAVVAERIGGGFKLKVLDYVFNRLPIAALDGTVAGTPLAPPDSILTYPDYRELVRGVLATLDNLDLLNRIQERAYEACASSFDWRRRGEQLAASIAGLRA